MVERSFGDRAEGAFRGAKAAVFLGPAMLVLLRDHAPGIPWPGHWDWVGGLREGEESPDACLAREMAEEVGLEMGRAEVLWRRPFAEPNGAVWYYVLAFPPGAARDILFGDEGDGWGVMAPEVFLGLEAVVPMLPLRLRAWLADGGVAPGGPLRLEGGR